MQKAKKKEKDENENDQRRRRLTVKWSMLGFDIYVNASLNFAVRTKQ